MSTEEWRTVSGFERYSVSSTGRVKWKERIRKPTPDRHGYLRVSLWIDGKSLQVAVSKLVAEAFNGPRPDGCVIRHRNGIKTDNRPGNLVYGTQEENEADKGGHGTKVQGTKHHSNKLNEAQVREIRRRYRPRDPNNNLRALAQEFDVAHKTVHQIVRKEIWKHIS